MAGVVGIVLHRPRSNMLGAVNLFAFMNMYYLLNDGRPYIIKYL